MTITRNRRSCMGVVALAACVVLPWRSDAQAAIKAQPAHVAVASHDLARGIVLSHADIESSTGGDSLVGWTTRRLIAMGEPLRAPAVAPPQLVKSGEPVEVVFESEGVAVTMRGKATRSAAVGERVVVRLDNQRRLEGTVVALGRVRVN